MPVSLWFGIAITGINISNYRKSPIYKPWSPVRFMGIMTASIVKGIIYSWIWPLPMIDIIFYLPIDTEHVSRHFIPLSRYGHLYS